MYLKQLSTALTISVLVAASAAAQTTTSMGTGKGGSPHEKTMWHVGGAMITVEYGRPFLKGRPEAQMMPHGQPWRTGADQATVITSDKPLTFGSVTLAANTSYTINTEPGDKDWKIIFGKLGSAGQWGVPYLANLEIGRAPMTLGKAVKPAEQVTISIDQGATPKLRIEWGTVSASTPFKVGS
jgi:hypothetical protein